MQQDQPRQIQGPPGLLVLVLFADLLEVSGGNNTGGQCDYRYSQKRGDHRDYSANRRYGIKITVAHGRQGYR